MLASCSLNTVDRMTLNERLTTEMNAALKRGDQLALDTLRTLRAQLIELAKRGENRPVTAEDELAAVSSAIKKRKEAIEMYEKGGRRDLVERERQELAILTAYLPEQLTAEQAAERVLQAIRETGSTSPGDAGKVMGFLMKDLKGKVDGKMLQTLVRKHLGG